MSPEFDDSNRAGIWKRLLLGAALVVFATAGATSVAAFREVDKVVGYLKEHESLDAWRRDGETDPGEPQTIMLLGSDRRPDNATDGGAGTGARSDTIILVRLDPDKNATALMSLPRDLKVQIPGPRRGQDQRRLRLRRPQAHAEDGEAAHRAAHQPRDQRGLPGLPPGGGRDRLRLRRHRPPLLQRHPRVRLHQRPARLPEAVR